jgi:hypothetical protein
MGSINNLLSIADEIAYPTVDLGKRNLQHLNAGFFFVAGHAAGDFLLGLIGAFPALDLDPLSLFEIFVMLKEVLNGSQAL